MENHIRQLKFDQELHNNLNLSRLN